MLDMTTTKPKLTPVQVEQRTDRLHQLCTIMDVPTKRLQELRDPEVMIHTIKWLNRNLGERNGTHELFEEAKEIILELLRK